MPAKKRPAVPSPAAPASKKTAKGVSSILKALRAAKELPPSVVELLELATANCLATYVDKRHPYEAQVVTWAGDALKSIEAAMETSVVEGNAAVDAAKKVETETQTAVAAKEAAVSGLAETDGQQREAAAAAASALQEAKTALAAAEVVQASGDEELAAAESKRKALEACQCESFQPLVEGTESGAKKVKSLIASGKKFAVDTGLLLALETTLKKDVPARGSWDAVVIEQFKVALEALVAGIQKSLEEGQPGKEARATDVAKAQADADAKAEQAASACDAQKAATATLAEQKAELKRLVEEQQDAARAVGEQEMAVGNALAALTAFRDGPLATFEELKAQAAPLPPPPEPVEDAAPEKEATPPMEGAPAAQAPEA